MNLMSRFLFGAVLAVAAPVALDAAETRTLTDLAERAVTVPSPPRNIACLEVLCYEKLFLLGAADRIVEMVKTDPPWMNVVDPAVARIPKFEGTPDREDLLSRSVDLVFLRYDQLQLKALAEAGLPTVVSQPVQGTYFPDAAAFADVQKNGVRLYADIIGGDAPARAERWRMDFDARLAYVMGRTRDIPEAKRPRIYYLRGPEATTTQGPDLNSYWYGKIAGASMIVEGLTLKGPAPMSIEDILRLDPEYIFVGRQYSPDLVLDDPRWQNVSAVRRGHVIPLPDGLFYWDGSTEGMLLAEFIAKAIHPDLFVDLDMAREVRSYYQTFYGFTFSDQQIARFLAGQTPDGTRRGF